MVNPLLAVSETVLLTGNLPPLRTPVQYLVAANGIFKRAANRYMDVAAPVQSFSKPLPGLATMQPCARLLTGVRLPAAWLAIMLAEARALQPPAEILFHVWAKDGQIHFLQPAQERTVSWVQLKSSPPPAVTVLCELHSHHFMPTEFSRMDDADEQSLRFYGVFGWSTGKPTIRLRAGVYGYRVNVPLTTVFDGCGPFEDLYGAAHV